MSRADLATTRPTDFPQFLGAARDNSANTGGVALARDWSASSPKPLWRQPIGLGWSGFVVVNDSAITQEQRGAQELITCYELTTGKLRWSHANNARFSEALGNDGPRATPTVDQGRIYAMGATGILDCLDGANGKPIWRRDVLADAGNGGNLTWGKSCSPLVESGLVIVTGGTEGPDLVAYHADTGEPAWRGRSVSPAYASATAATLGGMRQVVTFNKQGASGYRLTDGKPLWDYAWETAGIWGMAQPVPAGGDRLFLSVGYGQGSVMLSIPALDEGASTAMAVKPIWTNRRLRAKFNNGAVRSGFLYALDNETLVCLDLQSGDRKWRGDSYGYGQLLLADDLLIVQSEEGRVALVEAKPDAFRELTSFQALNPGTTCWNPLALSGRLLLVRNNREAACYELPVSATSATVARNP
jgi:outer membrane protein assembly factor BamB